MRQLAHGLRPGDIVIADRYFSGYFLLVWLIRRGVDVLVRQHQLRHTDLRRGKRLGTKDQVVAWARPPRPAWMDVATYAAMPETLTLREVRIGGLTRTQVKFHLPTGMIKRQQLFLADVPGANERRH